MSMAELQAHTLQLAASTATSRSISLDRPERKNPLTFDCYAELRDTFRALAYADDIKAVVIGVERRQLLLGRRRARHHRPAADTDMKGLLPSRA